MLLNTYLPSRDRFAVKKAAMACHAVNQLICRIISPAGFLLRCSIIALLQCITHLPVILCIDEFFTAIQSCP